MRAVVQRCTYCRVLSEGEEAGRIGKGIVVFLGVKKGDTEEDAQYIVDKLIHLRIFEDECNKMNLSVSDMGGEIMLISQFTLYGDTKHGRRPSFIKAEEPVRANEIYEKAVQMCRNYGIPTETGRFRTDMKVELENDGPVTILIDSEKYF